MASPIGARRPTNFCQLVKAHRATHSLTRALKRVSTEMSLHLLAYNLKRVVAILDPEPLKAAIQS
ncbi:hypothetical protein [Microvirga ossetica]|uniref:hypothetical protein n=1 Tax=Microvirga ossetica TaxID=1882682 RepID=UPI0012FFE21F|nr:hypothetical protein [Microvirga ossetica]